MLHSDRFTALEIRVDELITTVSGLRERLDAHISNHHSKVSTIKQSTAIGAVVSLLYLGAELLRRFAF